MVQLYQLHTKRQRKCRLTTKIPLTFREPTFSSGYSDSRLSGAYSPQAPPAASSPATI
ncbi:MAG: hypothetical protein ACR2OE_08975 [Thermomicrobiales bacterium]